MLDYYGRRLATCSSDKTIKVFEIEGETHRLTDTLKGHDAAVWCVSWAHPKYGSILASSSYDGRVLIWRENASAGAAPGGPSNANFSSANWSIVFTHAQHTASVNLLSWSPHDCGCLLACASSDGMVSVLEFSNDKSGAWDSKIFLAHSMGVNAVSWAPSLLPGQLEKAAGAQPPTPTRRFATGGSDCLVRLWEYRSATQSYEPLTTLTGHTDWVRDVSWSPSMLSKTYIASASQDKSVRIWTLGAGQDAGVASNWKCQVLTFECVIWRVSWSLSGNILAVSGGDNRVTLWKERVRDGGWECVKTIEE